MREFSFKPFEDGEHVLVDGEEYIAKRGDMGCDDCPFRYQPCDLIPCKYYSFEKVEIPKPAPIMNFTQLAEWLAKGNGQTKRCGTETVYASINYSLDDDMKTDEFLIRPWGSTEWIIPTLDIYERDCK